MAIRILLSRRLGELRWTQADLARKTGIRPSTINDMYHELCERVNLDYLDLICEALDCELTDILVRENQESTHSRISQLSRNGNPVISAPSEKEKEASPE